MKPAADAQDLANSPQVVTTTTTRRVVPYEEPKTPDLWEYLAKIRPEDWSKHIVYAYRTQPGPKVQIFRCTQPMATMPSGATVPIGDEQEIEFAITREFGGGVYRFLVKRGSEIKVAGDLEIGAPARAIRIPVENANGQPGGNGAVVTPFGSANDPTAQVASRAFDALGNQERTAAEIGFAAMRTGLDAVSRAVDIERNGGRNGQDDLLRQVLVAKLNENPMQQVLQLLTVLKELNGLMGNASAAGVPAGMMEKILAAMFEKFMNPTPAGAPVSATAEIARAVPGALSNFVEIMREQRILSENQVRALELQRGVTGVSPASRVVAPQPNPQLIPPVTAPANGATNMQQLEFAESKVIEILTRYWHREPFDADQAADDVIAFLEPFDEKIVPTLAAMGETGLTQYFQKRPILQQAAANLPKLQQFIRAFLKMHAEDQAAPAAEPAKPVLPN